MILESDTPKNEEPQDQEQRERSREKTKNQWRQEGDFFTKEGQVKQSRSKRQRQKQSKDGELTYKEYLAKEEQFHENQELIRSFLRIQQGREQPIDKFVKILYIYKGKYKFDHKLLEIMTKPKNFMNRLTLSELEEMIPEAEIHYKSEKGTNSKFSDYWKNLIQLIKYKIQRKKETSSAITEQLKPQVNEMMMKSYEQLSELEKIYKMMLSTGSSDSQADYWKAVLEKIKAKKLQYKIANLYIDYVAEHPEVIKEEEQEQIDEDFINASPILTAGNGEISRRMLTSPEQDFQVRQELAAKIFREEFEKAKERLETNLSVPKNQDFSKASVTNNSTGTQTYDYISKEILEFEKYKRMEEDEEEFDDWVQVETEGRFRDRKPIYLNRVRVSYDWNKQNKFTEDNPPPKMVQGYKFTIFYPDLLDKQKTPQYYLSSMESPDHCLITFKAGPPYKDVAFKIIKKQWDFSAKSGFESIFAKGILHLYFNFKKPRYWI